MVGFPHSEILGSKLIRSSSRLIAAYYVLHRLHAPRHPLDALKALDRSHYPCPQPPSPSCKKAGMSSGKERFNHVFRRACLIGQIKKNQNSRALAVSPRGTGQTSSKASLYDVERSGSSSIPKDGRSQTCSLTCDVNWVIGDPPSPEEMVEPDGIEPTTSCLQSRRSPS